MFCTVYRLRYLDALIKPSSPLYMRGRDGMLIYGKDDYDRMVAQLVDLETGDERMRLENAFAYKARDGGLLIRGDEMHFRGSKSKGETHRQTWWCMPLTKVIVRADESKEAAQLATKGAP